MSDAPASPTPPPAPTPTAQAKSMDDIMALCKRRGFVYQASEIYGGINGFWDYGPLGAQLKKNLRDAWWQDVIMNPCWGRKGPGNERVRVVPLETCIIQHPKVWEASGHIAGFNDPMVDDKETKGRFRADHLQGIMFGEAGLSQHDVELLDRVAKKMFETRLIPNRTVVASSPGEAISTLATDRKAQKLAGFRSFVPAARTEGRSSQWAMADWGEGDQLVLVDAVPVDVQQREFAQIPSPFSGKTGSLTPPRAFNLMFKTYVGATATEADIAYLRPETAQGIFIHFKDVVDTTRVKVPFGIANVGKSFRNEVTPRNFTFRSREFEQMELEFFCHPTESMEWFGFWRQWRMEWWQSLGLAGDNLRLYDTPKKDLAHYAQAGSDVEYRFPFTYPDFGELEGVAHRGDFDLLQHTKHSGTKLDFFDTERGAMVKQKDGREIPAGERFVPHCIEPAAGLDRGVLAVLCEAYTKDASRPSPEIMRFHPRLAPIKAAVFPLVNKDGMPEVAERLYTELVAKFGRSGLIETDAKQSIGKRYARMDEAGCPFCFTIDSQTLQDQTVTVRDRDTGAQERVGIDGASGFLTERLA